MKRFCLRKSFYRHSMRDGERGATMVEAAITLPVFLGVLLAMLDGVWVLLHWITMQHALDFGMRWSSTVNQEATNPTLRPVCRDGSNPFNHGLGSPFWTEMLARVQQRLAVGREIFCDPATKITICPVENPLCGSVNPGASTFVNPGGNPILNRGGDSGYFFTKIEYDIPSILGITWIFGTGNYRIQNSAIARDEPN